MKYIEQNIKDYFMIYKLVILRLLLGGTSITSGDTDRQVSDFNKKANTHVSVQH